MNIHDLLQLVVPLVCVLFACGNQWLLELFKLRKQKAEVSKDKDKSTGNINENPFEKWNFVFNCVRAIAVTFAVLQISLLVIQPTPLSNNSIFFISYDTGFIVFIVIMFFIDKIQNNVLSIISTITKLAAAVRLYIEKKEGISPESSNAIKDILEQLESVVPKKKK
jgi:hypothetical protein